LDQGRDNLALAARRGEFHRAVARGERSRLSVWPIWPGRAAPGLFISTHGSYRVSRIEVRPAGEKE